MSFSSSITSALFANADEIGLSGNMKKLRNRVAEKQLYFQNDDQPLAEAQKMADALMATKQRRPMVFEYLAAKNNWVITTFYINPQRLSIQTQKIKSKTVTRGGIYYHHHGDDNWQLSLSGTTGFSSMKGIESLEKAYHASGTLLKYKTYGPEKVDIIAGSYGIADYKDTIGVLDTFVSTQNLTVLGKIQAKFKEENNLSSRNQNLLKQTTAKNGKEVAGNALADYASQVMETYKNHVQYKETMKQYNYCLTLIHNWIVEFTSKNGRKPTAPEYYNNAIAIFQKNLKGGNGLSSDVIVSFAYYETISKYSFADPKNPSSTEYAITADDLYKLNYNYAFAGSQNGQDVFQKAVDAELNPVAVNGADQIRILRQGMEAAGTSNSITDEYISSIDSSNPENTALINSLKIQQAREEALRKHLEEIADWEQRERTIQGELKAKAMETMDDLFNDEWAPRRLILYYENRAYIGHFDSFSYTRVADTPLINYELRFTVEKQILGTMI